jgi:hypothetical protein
MANVSIRLCGATTAMGVVGLRLLRVVTRVAFTETGRARWTDLVALKVSVDAGGGGGNITTHLYLTVVAEVTGALAALGSASRRLWARDDRRGRDRGGGRTGCWRRWRDGIVVTELINLVFLRRGKVTLDATSRGTWRSRRRGRCGRSGPDGGACAAAHAAGAGAPSRGGLTLRLLRSRGRRI